MPLPNSMCINCTAIILCKLYIVQFNIIIIKSLDLSINIIDLVWISDN